MKLRHLNLLLGMGACAARTGAVEVKPVPMCPPPVREDPCTRVGFHHDEDGDGVWEESRSFHVMWRDGQEVLEEEDLDGDGMIDRTTTTEWAGPGRMSRETHELRGTITGESVTTWTAAGPEGGWTSVKEAWGEEGRWRTRTRWSSDLQALEEQIDQGADGKDDHHSRYERDAYGRLVFALEGKVHGTFYAKYHHEYDPEGREIFADLKHRGGDRKVEHEELSFVWEGCLIAESHHDAGPEGRETCLYIYDEQGREVRRECHRDGDDVADYVVTVRHAADGEQTTEWDTDGDGDADRRRWQQRDAHGHVLVEKYDSQADGAWDTIEAWEWSCPP